MRQKILSGHRDSTELKKKGLWFKDLLTLS